MTEMVKVPRELAKDLLCYGQVHPIEGVRYGEKSHRERLSELEAILTASATVEQQAGRNPETEFKRGLNIGARAGYTEGQASQQQAGREDALLPGLREALLWKPNTPQLENAMTYAWEQALKSFVRALEAKASLPPAPKEEG